jgi:hypothetical protein
VNTPACGIAGIVGTEIAVIAVQGGPAGTVRYRAAHTVAGRPERTSVSVVADASEG